MRYAIKAMRGDAVSDLHVEAHDELAAREQLSRQGYAVLSVKGAGRPFGEGGLRGPFPVAIFSVQLVALLDAGLNLVEAMRALTAKERDAVRRRVLEDMMRAVGAGQSFSQAIERLPHAFPRIYVAIVKASERTGDLRRALTRYLDYETRFQHVRKKILSALLYPAVLVTVGSLVLAFLMLYVVPRFGRIYEETSASLPFFSGLLLALGGWIERHGWLVLALALALPAAAGWACSRRRARAWIAARLWRVPSLGEKMKLYELARLYGTLGMLLKSGVPIVSSIDMANALLSSHLQQQLERAQTLIREGASISMAFAATDLSTSIADQLLLVGERTGQMGEMMERIAAFHDDDLGRWLDWSMRLLEPILMALIGVAVGLVVVLMYMPVFELAGSLQ